MLIINYTPAKKDSHHCIDSHVNNFVKNWITYYKNVIPNEDITVDVGQQTIITEFRIAVKQNLIDANHIKFKFEDQLITIHDNGRLEDWPIGFCDILDKQLDILLDL